MYSSDYQYCRVPSDYFIDAFRRPTKISKLILSQLTKNKHRYTLMFI